MGNQACCTGGANNGSGDFDHFHYAHSYNRRNHNENQSNNGAPRIYPRLNYNVKDRNARGVRGGPGAIEGSDPLVGDGHQRRNVSSNSNGEEKNAPLDLYRTRSGAFNESP